MSEQSRLLEYFLIVLFAGSVAALGIHELNQKYRLQAPASVVNSDQLIKDLQGESGVEKFGDPVRAQLRLEKGEEEVQAEEQKLPSFSDRMNRIVDRLFPKTVNKKKNSS